MEVRGVEPRSQAATVGVLHVYPGQEFSDQPPRRAMLAVLSPSEISPAALSESHERRASRLNDGELDADGVHLVTGAYAARA